MAGGALKFRHLGRKSSHRQALLRNLVSSLFEHESISTTWPKAKEAQRLAEKLITLGKKNTEKSRRIAEGIFYSPLSNLPKLFTTLRERYLDRPGGYTRVLRIESINRNHDQAPSAILELVDGPRDMRFAMTARSIVRERAAADERPPGREPSSSSSPGGPRGGGRSRSLPAPLSTTDAGGIRELTALNIHKVTRFRPNGLDDLEREVMRLEQKKKTEEKQKMEAEQEPEAEPEPEKSSERKARRPRPEGSRIYSY